jgi:uncharacterized membrane protein SpoIIM required for sporulation
MAALSPSRPRLARALIITRREVRDQLRDWRIITPVIVLTLFFPLLMNFTADQAVRFVQQYGAPLIGERLIPFLLMVVGFFPISVSLVIALESFVGEKERYSLEPLLSSPMTDTELYIGKTLAAMIPPLFASYLGITVYLIGLALTIHWYPTPALLAQILGLTTVQALVMVAGAVVISAQTTSVRAANLLASFIIIPFALLVQGESLIMFWGRYEVLWWVFVGLVCVVLVLIRMGVKLFNREELLGRDIDEINLRAGWAVFKPAFVGQGSAGPLAWYRREVLGTARRLAAPCLFVFGALCAGMVIGYTYAPVYPLPVQMLDTREIVTRFGEQLAQLGFVSPLGAAWVFFTNLRALAAATALGMFSLGVLGVILLMIPLGLTGYFAGQMALIGVSPFLFFAAFILPHGVFEIPAAILEGAVILHLGASVISPPPGKTLGDSFLLALAAWAKISLGLVVPLLAVAALMEAFVTPRVVVALFGG